MGAGRGGGQVEGTGQVKHERTGLLRELSRL